jgi:hypothetical protein
MLFRNKEITAMSGPTSHIFTRISKTSAVRKIAEQLVERPEGSEVHRITTVGDAAKAGLGIHLTCLTCGHEEAIAPKAMKKAFGKDAPLKKVMKPCGACESPAQQALPRHM